MYWLIWAIIGLVASVTSVSAMVVADEKVSTYGGTERIERTVNLDPDGSVDVSNISGDIKINVWESPQVRLVAVKKADSEERLKDFEVVIESTQRAFSVKVEYKKQEESYRYSGRKTVDYELTVPRTALLKRVSSVSGDILINGSEGYIKANTVSGNVEGQNLGGNVRLGTVSGTVKADVSTLQPGSNVKLVSVSGDVRVKLPDVSGATFKASTVSGDIENDFGLNVKKGKYVGASLKAIIGDGSVNVNLSTVSGDVLILKN